MKKFSLSYELKDLGPQAVPVELLELFEDDWGGGAKNASFLKSFLCPDDFCATGLGLSALKELSSYWKEEKKNH